jgi:hypothetical protein
MSEFRIDQIKSQDATRGPDVAGITTFTGTSGIVMPSGDTAYRGGRGRGVIGGGYVAPARVNTIDYITIQTLGNASDFGDLTTTRSDSANFSSTTRGIFAGGLEPGRSTVMDYITISATGNTFDFGDLSDGTEIAGGVSNSTRGLIGGGTTPTSDPVGSNKIEYVSIASLGNASNFGNLVAASNSGVFGLSSPTRGIFAGGYLPAATNTIDFVTISTTGDAKDFGDLTLARGGGAGGGNSTRGLFYTGYNYPSIRDTVDYITIASKGDAIDFGNASSTRSEVHGSSSDATRAVFAGGNSNTNAIDYFTIATTGNATDFGDLTQARRGTCSLSDAHGGIS